MRKLFTVLTAIALMTACFILLPTEAKAAEILASGTCGDNLIWTLDDTDTLTISGTGAMIDYDSQWDVPWRGLKSSIKFVIIENGVTSISEWAFCYYERLIRITIPNTVTSIGGAFNGCTSLTSVTLPDTLTSINAFTFSNCTSLTDITIPDGVINIGKHAFSYCSSLTDITIPGSVISIDSGAFNVCRKLQNVHYQGDQADWDSIEIADGNNSLINSTIHFAADCTNGHRWDDSEVTKKATCKEEGVKTFTCTACKATKTETIAKLTTHTYDNACDADCNVCGLTRTTTHNYKTTWSKDQINHWHDCSVCKGKEDVASHTPGAEATATTDQTCTVCGYVLKEATGETEPAPQPTEPSGTEATQPESTPATPTEPTTTPVVPTEPVSDSKPSADPTVWIVVAVVVVLLGGGAGAGIIIWKKKH